MCFHVSPQIDYSDRWKHALVAFIQNFSSMCSFKIWRLVVHLSDHDACFQMRLTQIVCNNDQNYTNWLQQAGCIYSILPNSAFPWSKGSKKGKSRSTKGKTNHNIRMVRQEEVRSNKRSKTYIILCKIIYVSLFDNFTLLISHFLAFSYIPPFPFILKI